MKHLGTVTLESERLVLRGLEKLDAEPLFYGLRNQSEFLYYTNKKQVTLQEQLDVFESIEEKYKNKDYYNWVMVEKVTNQIVGMINLKVNEKNDSVEFNYATDSRFAGLGFMTETLKTITDFALNKLEVNRIQGGCCVENLASKRVMEKAGYQFEGTLKNYIKLSDGYHDMHLFAIVRK